MESFAVRKNSVYGRFGVAACSFEPGDFMCEEFPYAIGPKPSTTCLCLECFIPLDATSSGSRCENCSWPLCDECKQKSELSYHARECEVFILARSKFYNLSEAKAVCVQLDCIMPLRVLLEKETNPKRWVKDVEPMEHHRERRFGTATWQADAQNVTGYLLHACKLKEKGVDAELVQRVIGILEVNSFEGRTAKGHSMRCLVPKVAVLSHSCTPNVFHSIHPTDGFKFHVRATKRIEKDSPLYACYTYTMSGTAERQLHLQRGKFFQCRCERCLDPTELGTHFSTLICPECCTGNFTSSDPLNSNAIWKCNKCSFEYEAENVKCLLKALQDEIDSTNSLDKLEGLLEKYKTVLHSNHFIMISIKNALIDSYGHLKGHLLSQLPDALLRRKIELCGEVLKILEVFESGKSRARGLMLFEIHAPLFFHANSQHQLGNLTQMEYLKQLEGARDLLDESLEILSWEDEEVCKPLKLAKVSRHNLESLIENVREIGILVKSMNF